MSKYIDTILKYPRLIICEEKHGTMYFLAVKPQDVYDISFALLSKRFKEGCWYYDPTKYLEKARKDAKTNVIEIPENFPEDVKKQLREKNQRWLSSVKDYEQEAKVYQAIVKAIKEEDKELAYRILKSREDYTYEGFEFETFSNEWILK